MPDPVATSLPIDRAALSRVFTDFRTLVAVEQALQASLNSLPAQIADLLVTELVLSTADALLPNSRVLTGSTGITIDTATPGLIKVLVNVATALGYTPAHQTDVAALQAAPVVTTAATGAFTGEEVLTGSTGLTIDTSVPGIAKLVLNVLTALNAAAINLTQPLTANAGATLTGGLECDTLRVDAVPAATVTASDHSIPINCNGVIMYMRLSTVP